MNEKQIKAPAAEAVPGEQIESPTTEQPRRLGLRIRSRIRGGESTGVNIPVPKTCGCTIDCVG